MSLQFFSVVLLGLSFTSNSLAADKLTLCNGKSHSHVVFIEKVGSDIHANLENRSLTKYGKIGNSSEGSYEIAGKERSLVVVKNIDLETLRGAKSVPRELMIVLLSGRQDSIGEEDMLGANAHALVSSLRCE